MLPKQSLSGQRSFFDRLEKRRFRLYPTLAGSVLFLALSLLILVMMPAQIKIRPDQTITPRTFPAILAVIMMTGALINLIKDLVQLFRGKKLPCREVVLATEIKAVLLLLLMGIYALLMPLIGFIASSVVFGILMLLYFRIRNWKYYVIVTVLAVVIGYLFKYVLNVRLP